MSSSSAVEHPTLKHSSHTRGLSTSQQRVSNLFAPSSNTTRSLPSSSRINRSRNGSIGAEYNPVQLRRLSEHHLAVQETGNTYDSNEDIQQETAELKRDIEAYENSINQINTQNGVTGVDNFDIDDPRKFGYDGPFQAPVGKETLGMIFSVLAVLLLAVAAGLTTVFDWVL